jgi:hypothetical protein
MAQSEKKIRPRKMFCPEENGFLWAEHVSGTAKEARRAWVGSSVRTWAQWRKERPGLRIVKVEVRHVP